MFYIDSSVMTPDHDNLRKAVAASMREGIQMANLDNLYELCSDAHQRAVKTLADKWYIHQPSNAANIVRFLEGCDIPEVRQACYDKGRCTSNAQGLKILAQQGFPFAVDILTYRKAFSYLKAIKSSMENTRSNGRAYPQVSYQKTNRISYSAPALMNIPKALLWSVVAPRDEDSTLISVDIHQQEPLIVINMLGIPELQALAAEHTDIYRAVYIDLFGADCTERERDELKMCWNATTYGASKKSLVERCRFIDGGAVYTYLHKFKELNNYIGKSYAMSKRDVQTVKTYFGTELYADKAGSQLRRSLLDLPIQGTGADILALLVEHFQDEVAERGIEDDLRLYYPRHDECILEVSNTLLEQEGFDGIGDTIIDIFEHTVDDWTQFHVDVSFPEPDMAMLESSDNVLQRCQKESFKEED